MAKGYIRIMKYLEFKAMNTTILLAAEGSEKDVECGFLLSRDYIEKAEKKFSRFSKNSELAQLNRAAGNWFPASADMMVVINEALRLHLLTQGMFDPGILNALERAGYNQSMDAIRTNGVKIEKNNKIPGMIPFTDVLVDNENRRIWMPSGQKIDLGGIAKGWIAEQAAHILAKYASACAVNAGGDLFMIGLPEGEDAWPVTLEDPSEMGKELMVLYLPPGAVATSTVTHRKWILDGKSQHHLIDPRTLKPAQTDWLSVTVAAKLASEAEIFAKCLLMSGSKEAEDFIQKVGGFDQPFSQPHGDFEYIAFDENHQLWGSRDSRELIHLSYGV